MISLLEIKQRSQAILELLVQNNLNEEIIRLQETDKFLESPVSILSMVGEIGKGKSTVANMLLGDNIFPVYMFEPLLVSVQNSENSNNIKMKDGNVRQLPQNIDFDKIANQDYTEVILSRKNEFLKQNNLKLIDGYDVNVKQNAGYLLSDIVILVMSANALLSINEKNVITTILDGKIKRVVFVVTHIDQVKPDEIGKISDFIHSQYPNISVTFVSNENSFVPNEIIKEKYGIEKVLEFIENQKLDIEQRIPIVNFQLNAIVLSAMEKLEQQKLELESKKAEKFENYKIRVDNVKFQQLAWEDTRIEYENRENQCVEFIQEELLNAKSEISQRLSYKLSMSPNPKDWWKKSLPFELKTEITSLSRSIDAKLQNRIATDYNWLRAEIQTKFKQSVEGTIQKTETKSDYEIQPEADTLKDLNKIRNWSRLGTGSAVVGAYFIVGPVGALVGACLAVLGDKYLSKVIEVQKKQLDEALLNMIDEIIGKISVLIPIRVHEVYGDFITKTEIGEIEWVNARKIDSFDCEETSKIENLDETIQNIHSHLIIQ